MYVPATSDWVRLRNEPGIYVVIWVDSRARLANLLLLENDDPARLREQVRFDDILPLIDNWPQGSE